MGTVKDFVVLIFIAAWLLVTLSACETSKHAEIMSTEDLGARAPMATVPDTDAETERDQAGVPFARQPMDQESLELSEPLVFVPEPPPGPASSPSDAVPTPPVQVTPAPASKTEETVAAEESGAETVLEGAKRAPSDVVPDSPTSSASPSGAAGATPETAPSTAEEEVPKLEPFDFVPDSSTSPASPSGAAGATPETAPSTAGEEVPKLEPFDFVPDSSTSPASPSGAAGATPETAPSTAGEEVAKLEPSDFVPGSPTSPASPPGAAGATPETTPSTPGKEIAKLEPSDFVPEPLVSAPAAPPASVGESGLTDVFFDFDQYTIRPGDAVPVLEKNAELLKRTYKNSSVLIEGHCDERGSVEYNLELGKRRAQAVKNYLVDLGIEKSRIQIVSYGKEKPFCRESKPDCWQQNRRGHFVLQ